ncbi:MAG TPA: hypothetical protein VFT32_06575 [Candidatus Eisenbacteria bacterium]|nr:hypothetical protein [Candidatus Eisenbacteria bacterium]
MDWFRRSVAAISSAGSGIPVLHRVLAGVFLVLLCLVAFWGVNSAGREGWVAIVDREQTIDQRAQVVSQLRAMGVQTKVEGDSVLVPAGKIDEAMLQLHSSGALGDEIFFKYLKETDLFGSRDKHDKQWLVAVQGRLAAMIQGLDYVRQAWVQIAEPADAKSIWWNNGRESTAAVILQPEPNETVTPARARAIAAWITGAIPWLKPSGVKILDKSGRFFRISETAAGFSGDITEDEMTLASMIEEKVARVLPAESRVSAQVRMNAEKWETEKDDVDQGFREKRQSGGNPAVESISVAVLIPEETLGIPVADRREFLSALKTDVRAAAGAREKDLISIRVAPKSVATVTGAPAAVVPEPPVALWRSHGPQILLGLVTLAVLVAVFRLRRGGGAVTEEGVVAEESLRAPGESILSAQDEAFQRIRESVRRTVTAHPREAAAAARRWLAP